MIERADKLTAPPVVGTYYMVPAIQWSFSYTWDAVSPTSQWWPVWGRKHNDIEFFDFKHQHYHIDFRFLTKRQWKEFENSWRPPRATVQAQPLNHVRLPNGPPKPKLIKMRCSTADTTYDFPTAPQVLAIQAAYAGKQCTKSKLGFICPHQRFQLGSIAPVDGVITCPLHGLRIDAATGVALTQDERR